MFLCFLDFNVPDGNFMLRSSVVPALTERESKRATRNDGENATIELLNYLYREIVSQR